MSFRLVIRLLAMFLGILVVSLAIPAGIAAFGGEEDLLPSFLWPMVGSLVAAGVILLTVKAPAKRELSIRGAFLFVSLAWIVASGVGALPAYLSGAIPSYTDSFFETMSGFTTTGASILTDIEALPRSILFWRSLTHWLGGMGIVVLTVALFPLLGTGGSMLLQAESPGPSLDRITPRIAGTAKILWLIYLGLSLAETILLMFGGMSLYDALTHTFGTMATGGFSPKAASVGHYDSAYIDWVITAFMVMAGMNFILFFRLLIRDFRTVARNSEIKYYLGIFGVASLVIALNLWGPVYERFGTALRYAGFQAASILTTIGYATADFDLWPNVARTVLFFLMFVGGSAGSTGGGMKVVRVVTMVKQGWNELKYLLYPRAVFHIKMDGKVLRKHAVYFISGFVVIYIFFLLITTLLVSPAAGNLETGFSTALVTLGNIGPGFAAVGPTMNYAFYPGWIKWYLSLIMMLGRLEIYTVLVIFVPLFWKR